VATQREIGSGSGESEYNEIGMRSVIGSVGSFLLIFLVIPPWLFAQGMEEQQVFGGEETVLRFGLDSTSNWWILTQPYERYMRLYVNGYKSAEAEYIMRPVFSPDGLHWGTVTYFQNTVSVLLDGQTLELAYTIAYDLQFADDGLTASVVGYIGGQQELVRFQFADGEWKQKETVPLPQAFEGSIVQDRSLTRFLCRVSEGNQFSVLMGDRTFGPFDQIHHLRWWQDSLPLFAARNGDWWAVYLGSEPLISSIDTVFSIQLNRDRSVAVIVYKRYQLSYIAKLAPDGQLQQTQGWDKVEDVKLHPSATAYGALVQWRNQHYFLLDGTRYPVRRQHTKLQMLYDGSGYYCLECRQLCDLMVNGERLSLQLRASSQLQSFLFLPQSQMFAYVYGPNFYVHSLKRRQTVLSYQYDRFSAIVYNWYAQSVEVLAKRGNLLYLLRYSLVP